MTNVITRLYASKHTAREVQKGLFWEGFPKYLCWMLSGDTPEARDKIIAKLREIGVEEATVDAYASAMTDETGLLVVQADYRPLNAKRIARTAIAESEPMDMGDVVEDVRVKPAPETATSILKTHPRMLTMPPEAIGVEGRPISMAFGVPLTLPAPKRDSAIRGGALYMGGFFSHLLTKERKSSVMEGGPHMSSGFWPSGLISRKERSNSVIRGGDLPLSRVLGWAPIIK